MRSHHRSHSRSTTKIELYFRTSAIRVDIGPDTGHAQWFQCSHRRAPVGVQPCPVCTQLGWHSHALSLCTCRATAPSEAGEPWRSVTPAGDTGTTLARSTTRVRCAPSRRGTRRACTCPMCAPGLLHPAELSSDAHTRAHTHTHTSAVHRDVPAHGGCAHTCTHSLRTLHTHAHSCIRLCTCTCAPHTCTHQHTRAPCTELCRESHSHVQSLCTPAHTCTPAQNALHTHTHCAQGTCAH